MKQLHLASQFAIFLGVILTFTFCGKEENTPSDVYFPQVRTIVADHCTNSCHAPSKGLLQGMPIVLEADSNIVNLAASIKAAVADPISPTNKRMPENGVLSSDQIDVIKKWYAKGGRLTD